MTKPLPLPTYAQIITYCMGQISECAQNWIADCNVDDMALITHTETVDYIEDLIRLSRAAISKTMSISAIVDDLCTAQLYDHAKIMASPEFDLDDQSNPADWGKVTLSE